jgi:hypothetical protein
MVLQLKFYDVFAFNCLTGGGQHQKPLRGKPTSSGVSECERGHKGK